MNQKKFKFILVLLALSLCAIFISAMAWSFDSKADYLSEMYDNINTLGKTIEAFNSLLDDSDLDALWVQRMDACMFLFGDIVDQARSITPPRAFSKSHAEYMRAMDELDAFRYNFIAGFNTRNEVLVGQAQMCWDRMFDSLRRYSEILLLEAGK